MQSRRSNELEKRFLDFGVSIIKLASTLQKVPPSVLDQIIRSATSIGANYAEAQNAISKADFKNKIAISKKEAAETRYWLRVIGQQSATETIHPYMQESQEILLILQKITTTLRTKSS